MIRLSPDDPRLELTGHARLVREAGWLVPYRLPDEPADPELADAARAPAGVRLAFWSDATAFEWQVAAEAEPGSPRPPAPFDVVVDGELLLRHPGPLRVEGLPPGRRLVEIWLPQWGFARLGPLTLDATTVAPPPSRPQWITYGSSLTQCTGAPGPSQTWPALVSTERHWRLRCLGFARQCHLDPVVARVIRDDSADLISLCVGTNIHGAASFSARTLGPALTGFIHTIREGHPNTPIAVISAPSAPERETRPNALGLTLANIRELVEETLLCLRKAGDQALTLLPGPAIFGLPDSALLADDVHPTPAGYQLMARRLSPLLAELMKTGTGSSRVSRRAAGRLF